MLLRHETLLKRIALNTKSPDMNVCLTLLIDKNVSYKFAFYIYFII